MGWRGQHNRDTDERERRRAYVRGLPLLERMAVHATDWLIAGVLMSVFVWAVIRG